MLTGSMRTSLAGLLFVALSSAQYVIDDLSFGQSGQISPNGRAIPKWHVSGEGHDPQLLSDRLILTPPMPGSTRGAAWTDFPMPQPYWTAEMSFRASGQERGSGNIQMWYVQGGRNTVGSNSVYTVGAFDGLVLTVDQYGGQGGMLRGFLNDGTASYKDHHNVDSLAFGHCDFSYRNLGSYSNIRITNDAHGFRVDIDDQPCFTSDQINLPTGYYLGVTAATADNPDSFEVSKFVASTTSAVARDEPREKSARFQSPREDQTSQTLVNAPEHLADADASAIQKQDEQFADLHNRLQALSHTMNDIYDKIDSLTRTAKVINEKQNEILNKIPQSPDVALEALSRRLETVERGIERIQRDVEGRDYKEHFSNLQQAVEGVRGGISDNLPDTLKTIVTGSAPRMGTFVFVVIAVQVMLLGVYIVYKKRRDNAPKKFL